MNTISNWAANAIYVKRGVRLSFDGRRWMAGIFDTNLTRVVLTSRQVGKSTLGATEECTRLCLIPNFNILYVAPQYDQSNIYSKDKIKPIIEESPIIRRQIARYNNVMEKEFVRGGKLYLRYAKDNPDRCRGITADMVHYDEIQDQLLSVLEPVINEVMFTSKFKTLLYTGTPKSFSNPAYHKWMASDRREWLVRCHHHAPVKYINLQIRNIGKHGPVCHHCGNLLDVDDGIWVKHNPQVTDLAGFHVSQLHCKTSHADPASWKSLLHKYENYDENLFLNEVMGLSADSSETPITDDMIRQACNEDLEINEEPDVKFFSRGERYAGIDWGHGQYTTALVIGQFVDGHFQIIFMKVYEGAQCKKEYAVPDIARIVDSYGCSHVHVDYGGSFGLVDDLDRAVRGRVTGQMWTNAQKPTWKEEFENGHGEKIKYSVPMLSMNKIQAISAFISAMKKKKVRLPRHADMYAKRYKNDSLFPNKDDHIRTFAQHFLNLRREVDVNEKTAHEKVRFLRSGMDDVLQAAVYCWIIANAASTSVFN